jgi:hypothetical protein
MLFRARVLGWRTMWAESLSRAAHVPARDNAIVNRLNKTKVEKEVDHEGDRQARLKEEGRRKKAEALERVRTSSQPRGAHLLSPLAIVVASLTRGHHRADSSRSRSRLGRSKRSSGPTKGCTQKKRSQREKLGATTSSCESDPHGGQVNRE